ncbi:MAG: acyl-CoA desaturase [Planctomycetota bacterium]
MASEPAAVLAKADGALCRSDPACNSNAVDVGAVHETREKPNRWSNGVHWYVLLWIAAIHLGALAAPFCFTWVGLASVFVLGWITGGLGICLGYHRLLAHSSFHTYPWMRRLFATLGTLAGEGPPITWVSVHRKHHQFSDKEGDPHSPRDGAWWSHMFWLFPRPNDEEFRHTRDRYAKDLQKDPYMRFLDGSFLFWHIGLGLVLLAAGWWIWDLRTGISLVVYGMFVRLVYVLHITWLVNSASHMWGYRNYETRDDSRNLWWVGLLAYGEGWHNNHHAFPGRARHGHRWWEFDITYLTIRLLKYTGLAWRVADGRKPGNS